MSASLVTKQPRIEIIDVLRGFTLLGIAWVHFTEQYYAGQAPASHESFNAANLADKIVMGFIGIFVQGKFFMIFSFLFGLSFFIQSDSAKSSGGFLGRFAWRLTVLFAIGFVHSLHYRGDILTIYALLGFVLLIAFYIPERYLPWIALFLIFNIPSVFYRLYKGLSGGEIFPATEQSVLEMYYNTLSQGSYISILKANLAELPLKMDFQIFSGRIYITLGLFLLGLYAGKKAFFTDLIQTTKFPRKLLMTGLYTIGGCVGFVVFIFAVLGSAGITPPEYVGFAIGGLVYDVFNTALATIYVAGIILLFRKERWHRWLLYFYAPGRMGLTTYLGQTLFGFLLFFSPGLGQLGQIGAVICLLLGSVAFAIQAAFSRWWLARFVYGPVEWLWRSLTYFKWQPFRKVLQPAIV